MNEGQKELLQDVLAEAEPPDFRAAMLGETLRLARRRRGWRQTRKVAGGLAILLLGGWLVMHEGTKNISLVSTPERKPEPEVKSYRLVETQALPARAEVATRPFTTAGIISSSPAAIQIATTSNGYKILNDAQLLALVSPKPAVLVRTGPHSEELVFADVGDWARAEPGN